MLEKGEGRLGFEHLRVLGAHSFTPRDKIRFMLKLAFYRYGACYSLLEHFSVQMKKSARKYIRLRPDGQQEQLDRSLDIQHGKVHND